MSELAKCRTNPVDNSSVSYIYRKERLFKNIEEKKHTIKHLLWKITDGSTGCRIRHCSSWCKPTSRSNARISTFRKVQSLSIELYSAISNRIATLNTRTERSHPTRPESIFLVSFVWHWSTCACMMQCPIRMYLYMQTKHNRRVARDDVNCECGRLILTFKNCIPTGTWAKPTIYEASVVLPEKPEHCYVSGRNYDWSESAAQARQPSKGLHSEEDKINI